MSSDELAAAAGHAGSADAVRACLARGDDPNRTRRGADSPLCFAAMYGHTESVQLLLAAGADPNHAGSYGRTPLHYAKRAEIATMLVDAGAVFDLLNDANEDALHDIITGGDAADVARVLLERGFPVVRYHTLPIRDRSPRSHLGWAAFCLRPRIVEALLAHGGSPDELEADGEAVVFRAIPRDPPGGHDIVRILLDAGADVDVVNLWRESLLQRLSGRRDPELFALALRRSKLPVPPTLLQRAAYAGNVDVVTVLLETDTQDVNRRDYNGVTALMEAVGAFRGSIEVVELLLRCHADPLVRDNKGNTALHHAARQNNVAIFERLIAAGCDASAENAAGYTPFEIACETSSFEIVKWLADRGAPIDRRAGELRATPLMLARSAGAKVIAEVLLALGADPTLVDANGATADDRARAHAEAVEQANRERERDGW